MASAPGDAKPDKSYLSSAVDSINPWASSRTAAADEPASAPAEGDHSTTPLYGQSVRTYPGDCPPLHVQWFHAVDVPKRKPRLMVKSPEEPAKDVKAPARPKKFTALSPADSRRLEARYQRLLEATEDARTGPAARAARPDAAGQTPKAGIRVAVNEDFLFDVDIEERELAPVYWLGPVYDVRRGTWFFQEGSNLRPCEENLAAQLEEGYLKVRPWRDPARSRSQSASRDAPKDAPQDGAAEPCKNLGAAAASSSPKAAPAPASSAPTATHPVSQPQSYRLFGPYMNNVATYQDSTTAWLSTDGIMSWVTTTVYERFAGGGYMSGVKLIRGYAEPNKGKDKDKDKDKQDKAQAIPGLDERQQRILKRPSAPPTTRDPGDAPSGDRQEDASHGAEEQRHATLQRQISSLLEGEGKSTAETEEEIRKREEQEMQNGYSVEAGEAQGRDIEHLVLVTHGIGQRLGLRMESVNFVHDVNVLRKTIKSVYASSADLRALNSELGASHGNCRAQVLPVCWRHLIEFPRRRQRQGEHDLGDAEGGDDDDYPSLQDITVEGVAFARSLMSDLALDVLLYQSSYREEIARAVVAETNRILRLFRERNPDFRGKVHLMGHSLGSAIFFDVLCRQREQAGEHRHPLRFWPSQKRQESKLKDRELQFDFDVDDFFCLGSPVGLFQMLKGRTIAARNAPRAAPSKGPVHAEEADDGLATGPVATVDETCPVSGLPYSVSSPKVAQLFNIFHPSDPISYRLEPLIAPAMASLKPQALPYTKKSIFGAVTPQGLTGIGAMVGQSVSGLWSSLSAGIASNLLNRSLGLTSDEVARLTAGEGPGQPGGEGTPGGDADGKTDKRKQQLAASTTAGQQNVLIDDEMETLFSTFEKSRASMSPGGAAAKLGEDGRRARRLRAEEGKVRALNRNGRVDYSIQESALDFNPINTIASHMGYWGDEDVSHFILSQLLSRRERSRKRRLEG